MKNATITTDYTYGVDKNLAYVFEFRTYKSYPNTKYVYLSTRRNDGREFLGMEMPIESLPKELAHHVSKWN